MVNLLTIFTMERRTQKQQARVSKINSDRLRIQLGTAGYNEEIIATAECSEMLTENEQSEDYMITGLFTLSK